MESALAIVGGIGVVVQLSQIVIRLGHDWKDAPQSAKSLVAELEALRSVLDHTSTNLMLNSEFIDAFEGRDSTLLRHFGKGQAPDSTIRQSLDICRCELEKLVAVLRKRAAGHKFGLERLKTAFLARDLRDAVSKLARQCEAMNSLVSLDTASLAAVTYTEVKSSRTEQQQHHIAQLQASSEIQQTVSEVNTRLKTQSASKDVQDALVWLSPIDYATRHSDLASRRQDGTGEWLLNSSRFQTWLSGSGQTLYCPGMPGAGKTTLLSMVVDYIATTFGQRPDTGVAFLYLDVQRAHEQSTVEMLARLLRQLTESLGHYSAVTALRDRHRASYARPSVHDLTLALSDVTSTSSQCFVLIDALDECQNPERKLLLEILLSLQQENGLQVFLPYFSSSSQQEIRASDEDVSLYLQNHIDELPAFVTRSPALQAEVKNWVLKSVQGMFLLARLHLNFLAGTRSVKGLRKTLESLPHGPEGYDQAYDDVMHRIDQRDCGTKKFAYQILSWIVGTRRPLSVLELRHALGIETGETDMDEDNLPDADDMLSACAGLVVVDEQSSVIRLVHHTTQEYFQRTWRRWFPDTHHVINNACLTYLSFVKFRELCPSHVEMAKRLLSYPLYGYACQHWGYHALQTSAHGAVLTAQYLKTRGTFASAIQAKTLASSRSLGSEFINFPFRSDGSGEAISDLSRELFCLSPASQTGVKSASAQSDNDNLPDEYSDLESESKRPATAKEAKTGWKMLADMTGNRHRAEICDAIAADQGDVFGEVHEDLAPLVNGQDTEGRTPLHTACLYGRHDIVTLLLSTVPSIDPNLTDISEETALIAATRMGHEGIVKSLLSLDSVLIHVTDSLKLSAFCWAAMKGHLAIMKLLLAAKPAGTPWHSPLSETPLFIAAKYGHTDLVRLLLDETDIDPDYADKSGRTALWLATEYGHLDIVVLLTQLDAVDVNHRDIFGQTPLMRASIPGFEKISSVLLDPGCAKLEVRDLDGRHALHYAIVFDSTKTMSILLSASPAIANLPDSDGRTPLHYAAAQNSERMTELLINWGAHIDAKTSTGITALMLAARTFDTKTVQSLLKAGADATLTDHNGASVLHHCAMVGSTLALKLLIGAGQNAKSHLFITASDKWGNTMLHHLLSGIGLGAVTLKICKEVSLTRAAAVECLLSYGVSVQECNSQGMSPLAQYLSITSPLVPNKDVCVLLLEAGSDASWRSSSGQTIAHLYAQGRDDYMTLEVLETLNNHGVDMSAVDNEGQTILHYLLRYRGLTEEVMRFLLEKTKLDIDRKDLQGKAAIQLLGPEPTDMSDLSTTEKEVETLRRTLKTHRPLHVDNNNHATSTSGVAAAGTLKTAQGGLPQSASGCIKSDKIRVEIL